MEIDIYDNDFIKSKHFFESNERMHETVDFIKEEAECGIR